MEIIELKEKHVKAAPTFADHECAMFHLFKEKFGVKPTGIGLETVSTENKRYRFNPPYCSWNFNEDKTSLTGDDERIMRTFELTEYN